MVLSFCFTLLFNIKIILHSNITKAILLENFQLTKLDFRAVLSIRFSYSSAFRNMRFSCITHFLWNYTSLVNPGIWVFSRGFFASLRPSCEVCLDAYLVCVFVRLLLPGISLRACSFHRQLMRIVGGNFADRPNNKYSDTCRDCHQFLISSRCIILTINYKTLVLCPPLKLFPRVA